MPVGAVRLRFVSVLQLGYWSYATVVGDVTTPFEPRVTDAESLAMAWVPVGRVCDLPLHPGFASSWEALIAQLALRPAVVVDAANVGGWAPDGW